MASLCPRVSYARATEDFPVVKLQSLDKVTARTVTFEVKVGSTVRFGPLFIKAQSCRKAPAIETPESSAFLQIWQLSSEEKPEWIFSGWMFASSPALSAMDHPIYDVWVLDCLDQQGKGKDKEELPESQVPAQPSTAPPNGNAVPDAGDDAVQDD